MKKGIEAVDIQALTCCSLHAFNTSIVQNQDIGMKEL